MHPRNILRSCNFVLSRNVVVRAPQSPRNYEHTGPFVDVDALLIAENDGPDRPYRTHRDLSAAPGRGSVILLSPPQPETVAVPAWAR